ncbi:fungal-specific transcription factor domain-containing protein [Aspergillus floccosus]
MKTLKRHTALHSRPRDKASLPCDFCSATFSRHDLRQRHMRRKHPEYTHDNGNRRRQRGTSTSGPREDQRPQNHPIYSVSPSHHVRPSHHQHWSTNLLHPSYGDDDEDSLEHRGDDTADGRENWSPSALQIKRGCDIFFRHVSDFVPFLHQPTFNPCQTEGYLIASMLCMAYMHGEDPDSADQIDSGVYLSLRCYRRARALVSAKEQMINRLSDNTCVVQSYILLQIYAMMYLCGEHSSSALKMHSSMISVARAEGMMQPLPTASASAEDLEELWWEFIKAESHKRTLFAVHQIDALWYQLLSIPRSISHLEVKHDLPCPEDHWRAPSSAEWAHRELLVRKSGLTVQYADAVRRFLSEDAHLDLTPAFDPYGAINIAQFLISSAREISGWSTMTGMLSVDRFEALRSSLLALCPFISAPSETAIDTPVALCTSTWHIAMIELHLWSLSHTGGVVASSINAMLTQSTSSAFSCDLQFDMTTVEAVQPHVDWFLRYLDADRLPVSEAPLRERIRGAMRVVGVCDGDVYGALAWAIKVFQQREKWQVGRLIVSCLKRLGE